MRKHQRSLPRKLASPAGGQAALQHSLLAALGRYLLPIPAAGWPGLAYVCRLSQGERTLLYFRNPLDARLVAAVLAGQEWPAVEVVPVRGRAAADAPLIVTRQEGLPLPVAACAGPWSAAAELAADVLQAAYGQPFARADVRAARAEAAEADGKDFSLSALLMAIPPDQEQGKELRDGQEELPGAAFFRALQAEQRHLLPDLLALLREDWPRHSQATAKQLAASLARTYRIPSLYRSALQEVLACCQRLLRYEEAYPQLVRGAAASEERRAAFARAYNEQHLSFSARFWRRVQNDAAAIAAQAEARAVPVADAAGRDDAASLAMAPVAADDVMVTAELRETGEMADPGAVAQACTLLPELDAASLPDTYLALAALAIVRRASRCPGSPLAPFAEVMMARWQAVLLQAALEVPEAPEGRGVPDEDVLPAASQAEAPARSWAALWPQLLRQPQAYWQRALAAKRDFEEASFRELAARLQSVQDAWDAHTLRFSAAGCQPGWRADEAAGRLAYGAMSCELFLKTRKAQKAADGTRGQQMAAQVPLACCRYPEQARYIQSAWQEDGEDAALSLQQPAGEPSAWPVFGIYDVADGMHLLLAVCWQQETGEKLAACLAALKQREHRVERLADHRENAYLAYRAELPPALHLMAGCHHPQWTLYEEMAEAIREELQRGISARRTPAVWEDAYLSGCPVAKEHRRVVRRLFRSVWGRLFYEQHYEPLQPETDPEKRRADGRKVPIFAVAKGWQIGLFASADEAREASEGFPHALSCEFSSKGTAEAWWQACSWPQGEGNRYFVCAKGRQFTVTAAPPAGQVLYEADRLEDVLSWLRAQKARFLSPSPQKENAARQAKRGKADVVQTEQRPSVPAYGYGRPLSPEMMAQAKREPVPSGPAERASSGAASDGSMGQMPASSLSAPAASPAPLHLFRGIQFDKHIFRHVPQSYQERFRKSFLQRLRKMERIFTGERQAAGNDFKLVAGARGKRVFKRRIGDHRLSMVYRDGILTLLALSSHDRQMVDIRKIRGKSIGYVYYDVEDFLQQLDAWQEVRQQEEAPSFGEYLATPQHFVYDEVQQDLLADGKRQDAAWNLSIVGNAGAGKSVVGLKWIEDELQKPAARCLYLTMSENLVYTLAYEFQQAAGKTASFAAQQPKIMTTFDFLREHVKQLYPRLPERCLLNAAQSLAVFRRFWREQVDWRQFFAAAEEGGEEEATLLMAWREIHGIIKGAARWTLTEKQLSPAPFLDEGDYQDLLAREKKSSRRDAAWVRALYRVFGAYQEYLHRHGLLDDNDVANRILQADIPPDGSAYTSAFIDECQDLTQREILAIFVLLDGTRAKRLASDRCQMVQPTYFQESWMRTTLNRLDAARGRQLTREQCRPRYLRYNYRSSRSIIAFQDYILQHFRQSRILTLKEAELQAIQVPPLTTDGWKPVWILPTAENRRLLCEELWRSLPPSDLMPIFAFAHARTREQLGMTEEDTVTDVLSCKGMEYPAVLLCDILSDMAFDPAMAWKYFYVGATRANRGLLIYEEAAQPGSPAGRFLQGALEAGLIESVQDLRASGPDARHTWLDCLKQCLSASDSYDRLETAEQALTFGQYELALQIFLREAHDSDMIAYCKGKVREKHGDFPGALESYAAISRQWHDRGRSRSNSVLTLLRQPEIEGPEFLAAFLLAHEGNRHLLQQAQAAWQSQYGTDGTDGTAGMDTGNTGMAGSGLAENPATSPAAGTPLAAAAQQEFQQALSQALTRYAFAAQAFAAWTQQLQQDTTLSLARIPRIRQALQDLREFGDSQVHREAEGTAKQPGGEKEQ